MSTDMIVTVATPTVPRRRSPRGEGDTLRTDLVEAAADLIAEHGEIEAVSLRAVARRAGVSPTAVYRHFDDHVELLRGTVDHCWSTFFEQLSSAYASSDDPFVAFRAMGDAYVVGLGSNGELYDGALAMLAEVAMDGSLGLVTNGIGEVQRMRVARTDIGPFFDAIVISGEVGVAKPGSEIFDIAFEQLGHPDKSETLIVGDSLTSDMQGGIGYGIATCLYAPNGSPETDLPITHRITDLAEIPDIVAGRS